MYEDAIAALATYLADGQPGDPDAAIPTALEQVGRAFGAERVYLRSGSGEDRHFPWLCEWRHQDVAEAGGAGASLCLRSLPWLAEALGKLEIVQVAAVGALPPEAEAERECFERHAVKSTLLLPLISSGSLAGVLGLEALRGEASWSDEQLKVLRIVADMFTAALERLRAEASLRSAEERLRETQRLETLGLLTGGVAHDVNNFLSAILGYSEVLSELAEVQPVRAEVEEIRRAAERASSLVDGVLSFVRRKGLRTRILDLDWVVADLERLLRRVVGDSIHIVADLAEGLGSVRADPGQIEQVIVNLAVNARDAMPAGGKLSIGLRNLDVGSTPSPLSPPGTPPGRYVLLSVSDTGCGIDAETRARIFEPFFTTKTLGKGTGLGLSTVFEIVAESRGRVAVESEPGSGTTFSILLPRVAEAELCQGEEKPVEPRLSGEPCRPADGTTDRDPMATVMVVEEEASVRHLLRHVIESDGQSVLEASDAEAAMHLCQHHVGPIDLLVTDLALPHLRGREVGRRLAGLRPEMSVLYTSCYPEVAIREEGVLAEDELLIEKPFTSRGLLRKLREALAAGSAARAAAVISSPRHVLGMSNAAAPPRPDPRSLHTASEKPLGA